MINPKLTKLNQNIDKTKSKIAELQARLKDQLGQKQELENSAIVAMFREEHLTETEFVALLHSKKEQ